MPLDLTDTLSTLDTDTPLYSNTGLTHYSPLQQTNKTRDTDFKKNHNNFFFKSAIRYKIKEKPENNRRLAYTEFCIYNNSAVTLSTRKWL